MLALLRPSHLLLWVMLLSHTNGKVEEFCGYYDRDTMRGYRSGMDVNLDSERSSRARYLYTKNENTKPSIKVNLWIIYKTGNDEDIATFDMDVPSCVNQWCEWKATLKTDSNGTEVFIELGDYVAGCGVSRKAFGDAELLYVRLSDYSYKWWGRDTLPEHCPVTEVKEGSLINLLVPDCHNYNGARLHPLPQTTATTAGNTATTTSSPTTYSLLTVISTVVMTIVVVEMVTASVLVVTTVRIVLKK